MMRTAALSALLLLGASPTGTRTSKPCHAVDGAVAIPAGVAPLGEDGPEAPGLPTQVAGFRIDRHEVTNRQFAAFVQATGRVTQAERDGSAPVFIMPSHPVSLDDPRGWWHLIRGADWRHPRGPASGLSGHWDDPVVQVSFEDASAYARWVGGRLPTVAQWERAARGGQMHSLPLASWTGDKHHPAANVWQGVFPLVDTGEDGHVGIAPVGCYDPNSWGLVDMIGNAWEWTSDVSGPGRRIIKGGSFLCAENYCANYRPAAWQAQEHDLGASHIGFRVAYG